MDMELRNLEMTNHMTHDESTARKEAYGRGFDRGNYGNAYEKRTNYMKSKKPPEPVFVPYASEQDHTPVWPIGMPFPVAIDNGEARFEFETVGPRSLTKRLSALAVEEADGGVFVYGKHSLQHPRQSGYQQEGQVRLRGGTRRAFTSSSLFIVEGKLVDVAILYVCKVR